MKSTITRAQQLLDKQASDKAIQQLQPLMAKKGAPWTIFHLMGIALVQKGEHEASLKCLQKALSRGGDAPETYHLLSVNYYNLGRLEQAEEYAKQALERKDDFLKAWINLGSLYRSQARLEEALKCYQKANQLDPKNAGIAFRIGAIYRDQGGLDKALELFDITLQIDPDYLGALLEKADIHRKRQNYEEALECLDLAHERHGDCLATRFNRAEVLKDQGRYQEAVAIFEELLEKYPKEGGIRINYALCLQELGQFEAAEEHYLNVVEHDDNKAAQAFSNYLMGMHYNPKRTKKEIFEAHLEWNNTFLKDVEAERPVPTKIDKDKRIRIGFISGGFRKHPVGWMITKALEHLPDEECEIYCYTTNTKHDPITKRIHEASDHWASVVGYNNDVISGMIRDDEIDILVDLSGHAADGCLGTIVREPAPIIVKWVGGLFNTTGLDAVDYLISDWHETPEGVEQYYTEKLVRLPDDYICFLPPDYAPDRQSLPAKRNEYITFGCFNNPCKINQELLERWAVIMKQVPQSRLLLKSKQYDTRSFTNRIIATMERLGIERDRIIFKGHSIHQDHLACYNDIDIALDPWPYSGGLTTCEALWMGVPVVTLPGPTFAGKHSATHLHNSGLSDFVSGSWNEYIDKAVALATDTEKLEEYRETLREQVAKSPICDGRRFAAHLSVAFRKMWEQRVDGYEDNEDDWANHITVESLSNEQIEKLTDGLDKTSLITVKDQEQKSNGQITGNDAQEMEEQILNKDFVEKTISETEELVQDNEHREEVDTHVSSPKRNSNDGDTYYIDTQDEVTICAPADTDILTTYVLLEQEAWFEPELDFVRQYLTSGMKAVDAGACFGGYTLPMANLVEDGKVYAFEPSKSSRSYLEKSKVENGFNNIDVFGQGLSVEAGKGNLKQAESTELNRVNDEEGEEMTLTTLDAWWNFAGEPEVDLIKVDVNGMEIDVLAGGAQLIDEAEPIILAAIGEDEQSLQRLRDRFSELDHKLFEYIPGPSLLAEHDAEAGVDPYLMNVIAIPESRVQEFKENGWIFDEDVVVELTDKHQWKQTLQSQPWAKNKMDAWVEKISAGSHDEYIEALNLACAAEQIKVSGDDPTSRSRKGAMMLTAAQKLIGLFNSGQAGIAAALTYVRLMNQLGKRSQAVEMAKQLMEGVNSGQDISVGCPFLPPLPGQDQTDIQTEFENWLTVRIVEAWIRLQNPTTYMAGEQERGMLKALEGNPEISESLTKAVGLVSDANTNSVKGKLNNWFWNKENPRKVFTGSISSDGQTANTSSSLKHLYLVVPGKQGGAHGIHALRAKKLSAELKRQKVESSIVSCKSEEFVRKVLQASRNPGHVFYSGIMGYDLMVYTEMGIKRNLFEMLGVPVFGLLGDHPYTDFMWSRMENPGDTRFMTPLKSVKEEYQEIYQPSSTIELSKFPPPLQLQKESNANQIPILERPTDILVPWGMHKFFVDRIPLNKKLKKLGAKADEIGQKIYQLGLREYEESLFQVFLRVTKNKFGNAYRFSCPKTDEDRKWLKVLSLVDWAIRKERRLEMLKTLAEVPDRYNVKVTAHPKVASFIPSLQSKENISWVGEVSTQTLDGLYAKSKIVFNCNPTFPNTIHGRVRSGMANQCYIISDYNPALDELFGKKIMGFVGSGKTISDHIEDNWDHMQKKAKKGYEFIQERFSEEKHASKLVEIISKNLR